MTGNIAPVVRSTGGPVADEDEISERVREWCEALGLTLGGDDNTEETPA